MTALYYIVGLYLLGFIFTFLLVLHIFLFKTNKRKKNLIEDVIVMFVVSFLSWVGFFWTIKVIKHR